MPATTENAPTPETGKRAEVSPQGCAQLDERFPSPEESSFGSNSAGRDLGRVAEVLWRLTSVALRAPPVSRQKTKNGTFYFAKNRTFLLCLDKKSETSCAKALQHIYSTSVQGSQNENPRLQLAAGLRKREASHSR